MICGLPKVSAEYGVAGAGDVVQVRLGRHGLQCKQQEAKETAHDREQGCKLVQAKELGQIVEFLKNHKDKTLFWEAYPLIIHGQTYVIFRDIDDLEVKKPTKK